MTPVVTQTSVDGTLGADRALASDIARLAAAIGREVAVIGTTLSEHPCTFEGGDLVWSGQTEHRELRRQLGALRDSVSRAPARSEGDPSLFRAELATLLSFAKTLASDAVRWRADFDAGLRARAVQEAAAREERERLTAKRDALIRHRDALQSRIDAAAIRMAQDAGGECRRTVPCISLADAVTVVSQWVSCPRQGFTLEKHWLVTLDGGREQVLVRRCYA